jgi:uncharacterized membrane protein
MKERHFRSVVKGATWRVCATMDTIILSYIFTGQISAALKIGAVEVLTKIALFYVHERVWMRFGWWRTESVGPDGNTVVIDNHYRSVIKGASYRFFGTIDTIVIALFVTGDYTKAFSIGATEVFTKIGLFYLHERLWYRISWGMTREETPAVEPVRLPVGKPALAETI